MTPRHHIMLKFSPTKHFILLLLAAATLYLRAGDGLNSSNATPGTTTPPSAKTVSPDEEERSDYFGYLKLKDKIWEAIRTKNTDLFIANLAFAKEFDAPELRQGLRWQIEALLKNEIFDLEILEIPRKDRAEIAKIQSAGVYGLPQLRYCLPPQKMLEIRYRYKSSETPNTKGSQGRRLLIGKDGEEWKIITLGGQLT